MKRLMTGNEAVARGAYEAGVFIASAYPGTPSTEIIENLAGYDEVYSEWAPNEKVALEAAIGVSIAGVRSMAAMKHVGVNVAADPLFTFAYTGVTGGMVLVSADDPGMHSSQNEQDNRYYAKFAKVPMLEPSDSQEAKDFMIEAFNISERYNTPVLLRMTTRVCHSKGLVELGERRDVAPAEYVRRIDKYVATPANARLLRIRLEDRLRQLELFSNETKLNRIELGGKDMGIIASGVSYQYAREVFGESVSYFKIGFSYPLPMERIREFSGMVKRLYVVEELEPFIEEQIKAAGIPCIGKERIPRIGELDPVIISESILGSGPLSSERDMKSVSEGLSGEAEIPPRPPVLCAGCPHRGIFYALSRRKSIMVTGDIGCYTLGSSEPLSAMDTCICMGASISAGHGAQKAFDLMGSKRRVVAVIGDSTFFHSGITGMMNIIYNRSNPTTIILDNRITGMTGHQENPGTGYTLSGEKTKAVDIAEVCRALGVENVVTVNPLDVKGFEDVLDIALKSGEPSVIVAKWPCALKKLTSEEEETYGISSNAKHRIVAENCRRCLACLRLGCPAISRLDGDSLSIDESLCMGCSLCAQVCRFDAIGKVGE